MSASSCSADGLLSRAKNIFFYVRDFASKLRLGIGLLVGLEGEVLFGLPAHLTVLVILKALNLLEFIVLAFSWVFI